MTIWEKFKGMLIERGMTSVHAAKVMALVEADVANKAMLGRWNDNTEGYTKELFLVLWFSVKQHAREWIDENLPLAWYRPLFEEE